jgi:hypothetical protein
VLLLERLEAAAEKGEDRVDVRGSLFSRPRSGLRGALCGQQVAGGAERGGDELRARVVLGGAEIAGDVGARRRPLAVLGGFYAGRAQHRPDETRGMSYGLPLGFLGGTTISRVSATESGFTRPPPPTWRWPSHRFSFLWLSR